MCRWATYAVIAIVFSLTFGTGQKAAVAARGTESETAVAGDFGGIGLLQTRTARFGSDGGLEGGTTFIDPYRRWYFRLTLVPWFEGTFRYTDIRSRFFSNIVEFSGSQTFKDRGADIKVRIWPESRYVPAIALGLQDGLGTGLFNAEYLVANKRYLDLDFSFGLAWGYLGNGGSWTNPLTLVSDAYKTRIVGSSKGGELTFGTFFSGEKVAPFFGIQYQSPISGLTFKIEYEGNDYKNEPLDIEIEATSRWNFGVNYRPFDWLDVSLALERGNSYMSRLALLADLHDPGLPKFDPPPPAIKVRESNHSAMAEGALNFPSDERQVQSRSARDAELEAAEIDELFSNFEQAGLELAQIELTHKEVRVHLAFGTERISNENAEQLAGAVLNVVPGPVERVSFINDQQGGEARNSFVVLRKDIERNAIVDYLFDDLESEGFYVSSLDLTHDAATLLIQSNGNSAKHDRGIEVRAAQALLRAAPTPVERITIIAANEGFVHKRTTFHRDEINREAAIGELFDVVDGSGFRIESVEIEHRKATVYVSAKEFKRTAEYVKTAHKFAIGAPFEVDEVRIVGLVRDAERASITLMREGNEWKTAASASDMATQQPNSPVTAPIDTSEVASQLFTALAEEDLIAEGVQIMNQSATIYLASRKFRQLARNIGRAARVAANVLPVGIEEFTIIYLSAGVEQNRVTVWRKDLEQAQLSRGSPEEILAKAEIRPPEPGLPYTMIDNPDRYPNFAWGIGPTINQHIGGSSKLILYQVSAKVDATLEVLPGLFFTTSYGHNIYNNYDRIRQDSDSVLSHVRSDVKEYLQQGENSLSVLQGDYVFSPLRQVYARLSAGLFEDMYGGVSGEILYRPFDSRFAIGADFNWVRQREFDVKFKFRNYNTGTGHLNVYYQWPWYEFMTSLHVGKYLARDRGGTLIMSRRFDSGIRTGAWVTLTNVPFEEFGEGSFDKGIFISIPFDLFLMKSTTAQARFGFRPLTRDGGQMVHVGTRLYDLMGDANRDRVVHDWHRFLD